jgi:dynein heavy chain
MTQTSVCGTNTQCDCKWQGGARSCTSRSPPSPHSQESFQKLVSNLRSLSYDILDVKATRWHDDFNAFKSGVKDLEVMLTNVIQMALDAQPCLVSRAELVESFTLMSRREFVRRFVEKKTSEFYNLFNAEINTVKKLFDTVRRTPPKSPILPKYAGTAR